MGEQLKLISESFLSEYTQQANTNWHMVFILEVGAFRLEYSVREILLGSPTRIL